MPTIGAGEGSEDEFYSDLLPNERRTLLLADEMLEAADGDDAELTFRKGDGLLLAHGAVNRGTFSAWLKAKWPHHRTYAYSFMKVAEQLAPYRLRLVEARVERATLLALAVQPQRAEELLTLFETGRRPSVGEAKVLISVDGASPTEGTLQGGIKGLRKLHAAKGSHLQGLVTRLGRLVQVVEGALASPRLTKKALSESVAADARIACAELLNLCAFVHPADKAGRNVQAEEFVSGNPWKSTVDVLRILGEDHMWPPKTSMERWLRGWVLPTLRWAALNDGETLASSVETETLTRPRDLQLDSRSTPAPEPRHGPVYLIPAEEVREGSRWEIKPSGTAVWTRATLSGGMWIDRHGEPLETASGVALRIPLESAAQAVQMVRERYERARISDGPEAAEDICRRLAAGLASIMVCGILIHIDEVGPAADIRGAVADDLWRRASSQAAAE